MNQTNIPNANTNTNILRSIESKTISKYFSQINLYTQVHFIQEDFYSNKVLAYRSVDVDCIIQSIEFRTANANLILFLIDNTPETKFSLNLYHDYIERQKGKKAYYLNLVKGEGSGDTVLMKMFRTKQQLIKYLTTIFKLYNLTGEI